MHTAPFFSIIISTRDRPELFLQALNSVIRQTVVDMEIIVVIDGSHAPNLSRYRATVEEFHHIRFLELPHRPNGHGQSYSMNFGVQNSTGRYLCFLDDDDYWTDDNYLQRLYNSITSSDKSVDVHYSNQRAIYSDGAEQSMDLWLADLVPRVHSQKKHIEDTYFVDTEFLLSSGGFAHLNCSVFERSFYNLIGGMDETIRYENDRDIFIRSLDAAKVMLFSTHFVSLHNIPDRKKKSNMSTVYSDIDKKLYQIRVYDKGISNSKHDALVRYCSKAKVYELKHASSILVENNRYRSAAHFAKSALIDGFNFGWLAYTVYLVILSRLKPGSSNGNETS